MNGRKRHILVDTLELLLVVLVQAANIQDWDGAKILLRSVKGRLERLRVNGANAAYAGKLADWTRQVCHWT